ncbi:uncharacterized protein [Leuresthes tenuis]|uniref:uncharacterized protein isoform X2 n=1 Tax=Leuresthes tenuis TaxID=355514 RepID=UPI003B505015
MLMSSEQGKMDLRAWRPNETKCLIAIWAEEPVQRKLEVSYRNRAVYEEIAEKMEQNGCSRSWRQCQRKIKHLKYAFRQAKCSKSDSYRGSCPFYDELDRVLGDRQPSCPGEGAVLKPRMNSSSDGISKTLTETDDDNSRDDSLPLSSLRLIVPPLQLVSAALWEILKQGAVKYYELLEEFVSTVLETVPELLTYTERIQLVMGLRARMSGLEAEASITNFLKLVRTLVDDKDQRATFFQKIFPTVFGPKYDSALQDIMRKFLFNLQRLLPVPSLEQTSLWLSLSPAILKECADFVNQPEHLNNLIQHHKHHGHEVPQALRSAGGDCILSSLSFHLPKVEVDEDDTAVTAGSVCIDNSLGNEPKKEEEENFEEVILDMVENVETNEQLDDLTEQKGAFIEIILQPFDETESNNDDDMEDKGFHHSKTLKKKLSGTFKCLVCGQECDSCSKLKQHKAEHHPEPKIPIENNSCKSENEPLSFSGAPTHNRSNPNIPPNFEQSNGCVVCHVCGKVFTHQENFDEHQSICVVRSEQHTKTNPLCSTSSADHSEPTRAVATEEMKTESSDITRQESATSDPCERSSLIKTCSSGMEIFTCSADLTNHMRCHNEQSPGFSSCCEKEFESRGECETDQEGKGRVLNQHPQKKKTLAKENFSCNTYQSGQDDAAVADSPANSQASKSSLTCQECGQCFTYNKCFQQHRSRCSTGERKKKTKEKLFIISACNFQSAKYANESHAEKSSQAKGGEAADPESSADGSLTRSRIIKCTMCMKNFPKVLLLKRHYLKSHQVRGSYPCPVCKRAFVRLCELLQHQRNKKLYQCTVCQKCYVKPGQLNNHNKVHAASASPRVCETCGKSFQCLAQLNLHKRVHKDRPPYLCSYCGKRCSTKDYLRTHTLRHTGGLPCPVCGKKFYQKAYLKWHLYKHTGQEPYLCDTCGTGWPSAAQLKIHMVKHTDERPFKCEDCGACYKRGSHLMAHRRSKHMKLRPFVCNICSKAFRLNNELVRHMKIHTENRPFPCPRCRKTFSKKGRLRAHRETACL